MSGSNMIYVCMQANLKHCYLLIEKTGAYILIYHEDIDIHALQFNKLIN